MKPKGIAWTLSIWMVASASLSGIAGYGWLENNSANQFSIGSTMGSLSIAGLTKEEATKLILNNPGEVGVPQTVDLQISGEVFTIQSKDIDLQIDERQLALVLEERLRNNGWENMLQSFTNKNKDVETGNTIVYTLNKSKIIDELRKIAESLSTLPVSATATLSDNQLIITPDIPGQELDVQKVSDYIEEQFQDIVLNQNPEKNKIIDLSKIESLLQVPAPILASDLEAYRLVGNAKVPMADGFSEDATFLVKAIQSTIIKENEELHVQKLLETAVPFLKSADSPSRAASALYTALLSLPEIKIVERYAAPYATNYTEPGLEAIIGQEQDLVIMNTTEHLLYIVAEKIDSFLHVAVFSPTDTASSLVYSDIVKSEEPAVIYSPVRDLLPDETRVIAAGREGMTVNVYRLTGKDKVLLYEDVYLPQNRIMEIGMKKTTHTSTK